MASHSIAKEFLVSFYEIGCVKTMNDDTQNNWTGLSQWSHKKIFHFYNGIVFGILLQQKRVWTVKYLFSILLTWKITRIDDTKKILLKAIFCHLRADLKKNCSTFPLPTYQFFAKWIKSRQFFKREKKKCLCVIIWNSYAN